MTQKKVTRWPAVLDLGETVRGEIPKTSSLLSSKPLALHNPYLKPHLSNMKLSRYKSCSLRPSNLHLVSVRTPHVYKQPRSVNLLDVPIAYSFDPAKKARETYKGQ